MLQHYPSTTVVFQSSEYKNFTMINGNRPINQKKIDRIIGEINNGNDMLNYYPIQVRVENNKLAIIDGQHRFFISKKLKRPVNYILVSEQKSMKDIAVVNSNVEKWKSSDFINCYIQDKNKNYEQIKSFIDTYGFAVGVVLSLLANGEPGKESGATGDLQASFQSGTFKVEKWKEAVEFAEMCKRFEEFKNWRGRSFLIAIYRINKAQLIQLDDLVAAFKKNKDMIQEEATYKDYVMSLEKIMNIGKHKRITIL